MRTKEAESADFRRWYRQTERLFRQRDKLLRKPVMTPDDEMKAESIRLRIMLRTPPLTVEDEKARGFIRRAAALLKKRPTP